MRVIEIEVFIAFVTFFPFLAQVDNMLISNSPRTYNEKVFQFFILLDLNLLHEIKFCSVSSNVLERAQDT